MKTVAVKLIGTDQFMISLGFDDGHQIGMTLDVNDVKTLNEMITKELQNLNQPKEEIVWNPKSQRHEKVVKK